MPARQPQIRWSVRLSAARRGGWRAWLVVNGDFEHDLAGQESDAILAPHVEAESRRGRDFVRVTIAMTIAAPDVAQALTAAWWTFRKAVGNDAEGWDLATATAEIRPEGTLAREPTVVTPLLWRFGAAGDLGGDYFGYALDVVGQGGVLVAEGGADLACDGGGRRGGGASALVLVDGPGEAGDGYDQAGQRDRVQVPVRTLLGVAGR